MVLLPLFSVMLVVVLSPLLLWKRRVVDFHGVLFLLLEQEPGRGFKLAHLLKLDTVKAFDQKTNLLQFIVKAVQIADPSLLDLKEVSERRGR